MDVYESLMERLGKDIQLREKRPGVLQLLAPLFHEDGDMLDIFLDTSPDPKQPIRISDHGMTLMRLSYSFELDTPNKERIFQRILAENGVSENGGVLYIDTFPAGLPSRLACFAQTVAKISSMQLYKRETIESLFMEILDEFVTSRLQAYHPRASMLPMSERSDLEVDYAFYLKPRPIYLFGVRDNTKARLAAIACLEFMRAKVPFKSIIVHEDLDNLSKKDRMRITSAADKQFPTIDEFRNNGEEYFEREAA